MKKRKVPSFTRSMPPFPGRTVVAARVGRMSMYERYVAIGDSSTEGLDDPDGKGGYIGWANRLAAHVARSQTSPLLYANLAIPGRSTRPILEEQLEAAFGLTWK